jgi:hypothetical protein
MSYADKLAEGMERTRGFVTPALLPGEQLIGVIHASRKSGLNGKVYAIGTTDQRLILVELDRRMSKAKGTPITVRAGEITQAIIDGYGAGLKGFLASSNSPSVSFRTANEKYAFHVMGGWSGEKLMGKEYMVGLDAFCEFIWAATH